MKISIKGQHFIATDYSDDERTKVLNAGFISNPQTKQIETTRYRIAAGLRHYFDNEVKKLFRKLSCEVLEPWTGRILLPTTEKLDRYQRLGVLHALERNHSYLAFEQGLGKTPTAAAIINSYGKPAVVLCPPSLVSNWVRELNKWGMGLFIETLSLKGIPKSTDVLVVPDTTIDRGDYDKIIRTFMAKEDCILVVDEAQRFTKLESYRTHMLFGDVTDGYNTKDLEVFGGLVHRAEKVVCLSGTPMRNRPIEMFANLSGLAMNLIDYRNKLEYGTRYCGGFEGHFGWNFNGASNIDEWRSKIHKVYLRREEQDEHLKIDKPENIVYIKNRRKNKTIKLEQSILTGRTIDTFITEFVDKEKAAYGNKKLKENKELGLIAQYRKEVGSMMVAPTVAHVKNILETTTENILVFCWHDDPLESLVYKLQKYHPLVIQGKTPVAMRDKRVALFEAGHTRLFILKIQNAVGYNMNRADRVVFMEFSWVPGDNDQARFRPMRRGKTSRVLSEYLCLEDTLSQYVLERVIKKKKVVNAFINKRGNKK